MPEKFKRNVPITFKELETRKINRSKVFLELCEEFKKRYPYITLIYAYINPDVFERLQYMLIFKFKTRNKTPMLDVPMIKYTIVCGNTFSFSSLEGFDISRYKGQLDAWFEDIMTNPATYPEMFFKDIINRNNDLTYIKNEQEPDKFWKNPANADILIKHLDTYISSFYYSLPRR